MGVELPVSRALSKAFPTSHYHLRNSETSNSIEGVLVPSLWGSRTDQILASQAFDFELDDDPDVERILMSLSLLEVWPESHWPGFVLRQTDVL